MPSATTSAPTTSARIRTYAYVDPLYIDAGGYYPYTVEHVYDPIGYDYTIYSLAHLPGATAAAGTEVPELLDRTTGPRTRSTTACARADPIKT